MQINELISSLKTPTKLQKTIPYKLPKQKTEISKVNSPLG